MSIQVVPNLDIDEVKRGLRGPEMTAMFQRMAERLIETVENDSSVLLPRSAENGQKTISDWFFTYHDRFITIMLELFREETPGLFPKHENDIRNFLLEDYWPLARRELSAHVLRRMAIRWAARQYTDATLVMPPERQPYGWRLPLKVMGREQELGQIALDEEGNILKDRTTPREQYREALAAA